MAATLMRESYSRSRLECFAMEEACVALEKYDDCKLNNSKDVLRTSWKNLKTISHLGSGSSSDVFQVATVDSESRYSGSLALKCLGMDKLHSQEKFLDAAIDLAMEAETLSKLEHKNIIKIRGTSNTPLSESYLNGEKGYFILLDVLEETLRDRVRKWRRGGKSHRRLVSKFLSRRKSLGEKLSVVYERLETVALGVAEAMQYVHSNNLVLRDLKSENVGFDPEGNVRLFDFGMARAPEECEIGLHGTIRYMAPEVMRGLCPSSFESDVYAFGILLWEICAASIPFGELKNPSVEEFIDHVTTHHCRPPLKKIPCEKTRELIEMCWDPKPWKRPSFDAVCESLRDILEEAATEDVPLGSPRKGKVSDISHRSCVSTSWMSVSSRSIDSVLSTYT